MNKLQINLASLEDLTILNYLYADMNSKPLMSQEEISKVWQEIEPIND